MAVTLDSRPQSSLSGELSATRKGNFPSWFREVIKAGDLASESATPGCMVVHNLGCELWEQIKGQLDARFKEGKHCKNWSFPALIPSSLFAQEAEHVEGFAQECALVTHSRIRVVVEQGKEGPSVRVIPDPESELSEPYILRPTSETIIGETMRQEIEATNELPFKVNQWCNVFRWERHTRPFLRTLEFWWQEGHCAFASQKEAAENAFLMARVYELFMKEACALPVILGKKSPGERFAGADETFCLEAMMQDGKAVQAGTSHYLGQHFAKASNIRFRDSSGERQFVHTTSWGVSTRLIGAMIMVHSDDYGLRTPPRLSVYQVVILPAKAHEESKERDAYIERVQGMFGRQVYKNGFSCVAYEGREVSIHLDERNKMNAGEKKWDWRAKGVPICLEIGPREAQTETVTMYRRDEDFLIKTIIKADVLCDEVISTLGEIQANYYKQAEEFLNSHIYTDIPSLRGQSEKFLVKQTEEFLQKLAEASSSEDEGNIQVAFFESVKDRGFFRDLEESKVFLKKQEEAFKAGLPMDVSAQVSDLAGIRHFFANPENIGFVRAPWYEDKATETMLKDLHVTIRCLPLEQDGQERPCVLTGRPTHLEAIFGRSY